MPFEEILHKFKAGTLRSGSDKGPKVTSRKQAIAIAMKYKREGSPGGKRSRRNNKRGFASLPQPKGKQ